MSPVSVRAVAIAALAALMSLGTGGCAYLAPTTPTSTNTGTTWTFQIGSTCAGRLNSSVNIYVDSDYKGQTTGRLDVSVTPGNHTFEAFTTGRRLQWGPDQSTISPGGLTSTLDC
jgi:hypothetical protein